MENKTFIIAIKDINTGKMTSTSAIYHDLDRANDFVNNYNKNNLDKSNQMCVVDCDDDEAMSNLDDYDNYDNYGDYDDCYLDYCGGAGINWRNI